MTSLREQALLRAQQSQQSYLEDSDDDEAPPFATQSQQQQQPPQQQSYLSAVAPQQQHQQHQAQQFHYYAGTPSQQQQQHQPSLSMANSMMMPSPNAHYAGSSYATPQSTPSYMTASAPVLMGGGAGAALYNSSSSANNTNADAATNRLASDARDQWRQYGHGVTQALEEKRQNVGSSSMHGNGVNTTSHQQQPFTVRVIAAHDKVDLAGKPYTAYVIRMQQQQSNNEWMVEHRYSDFWKLHQTLQQYAVSVGAEFPTKHWAGRLGSWTPSKAWAPAKHAALVQQRQVQLDVWLVHVADFYFRQQQQQQLAQHQPVVQTAIHAFFHAHQAAHAVPPCQREQAAERIATRWNNPLTTTLGSTIRQATCTVNYMCKNNNNNNSSGTAAAAAAADQTIPLDLLQAAEGLCFMTVLKAGLVVSGRFGTGLVVARLPSNNNYTGTNIPRWSAPCAVSTAGIGWGAQVGGDVTHYLIVLTTKKAVHDLVSSSSVQLGAELGVAVGPTGRGAQSSVQTGDWTLHAAYSYAHASGLFVGMSLEGSVVQVRDDVNAVFYGQPCHPADLLQQGGPPAAAPLYQALYDAMQTPISEHAFRPTELFNKSKATQTRSTASASWKQSPTTTAAASAVAGQAMMAGGAMSSGGLIAAAAAAAGSSSIMSQQPSPQQQGYTQQLQQQQYPQQQGYFQQQGYPQQQQQQQQQQQAYPQQQHYSNASSMYASTPLTPTGGAGAATAPAAFVQQA